MNSVSPTVESKVFTISLLPSPSRLATVKPAPVSCLKRLSASATARLGSRWRLPQRKRGHLGTRLHTEGAHHLQPEGI
jgi:hypothetical protein